MARAYRQILFVLCVIGVRAIVLRQLSPPSTEAAAAAAEAADRPQIPVSPRTKASDTIIRQNYTPPQLLVTDSGRTDTIRQNYTPPQLLVTDSGMALPHNANNHKSYYDESKIVTFVDDRHNLVKAPQTVVTAYFRIKSKHSSRSYTSWMTNMLSLQDPMVIFLSPSLIPEIKKLREHALHRTVIIPMEVGDVPLAQDYNASFWEHQLSIDPEAHIHHNYYVFWIWLSKSWWVTQAIRHNFFDSQVFVWTDMGCFRNDKYNHKTFVQHMETIPRQSMLFLAHHTPILPPDRIWNIKRKPMTYFFTSGSMMAGYADTFQTFHQYFLETMQVFLDRDMFIGEDQMVLQSACLLHPEICAYAPHTKIKDNRYFGLRYVLHFGGNYNLWYPPPLGTSGDEAQSTSKRKREKKTKK